MIHWDFGINLDTILSALIPITFHELILKAVVITHFLRR
jgi:hypothetical protein